jgi:hypothetical protein
MNSPMILSLGWFFCQSRIMIMVASSFMLGGVWRFPAASLVRNMPFCSLSFLRIVL